MLIIFVNSTISWSLSFYPQPILNWRRRSTSGFTADFSALNVVGFLCYSISTAAFLYSPTVIHQYALRHPTSPEPTVRFNDLAFAFHALLCCIVVYSQFWHRLWHFDGESRPPSPAVVGIICGSVIAVATIGFIVGSKHNQGDDATSWASIDVIYALSYVKLLITFTKYIPQVLYNYQVKSTVGWSVNTILCDFVGGVLSLIQLIIDSALEANGGDFGEVVGANLVKLGLAMVSLFFDAIFLTQHYVLYRHRDNDRRETEETPLFV
ncbi:cystinosin [Delphinella strobiligena]|nr:cystinosin [Delphinella strobiligena]